MEGASKQSEQEPHKISRRALLALAGNAAVAAGVGLSMYKGGGPESEVLVENAPGKPAERSVENIEMLPRSESFEAEKLGWQRWWELKYNEVQFVNERGVPVGNPVEFENFVVKRTRTGADGKPEEFDYLLAPGAENKEGMLKDNLAPEWIRYVRADVARREGCDAGQLRIRHITEEFEKAVARGEEEPELRESILAAVHGGNGIESMLDLVAYYGLNKDKAVHGDTLERTRAEYLKQEITFHNRVPKVVQSELRGFIVGLAAQESRFNAGLPKNHATAEGILQLKDEVRKENGHHPEKRLSFTEEVDVAGKHFSNVYTRVRHWMRNELVLNSEGRLEEKERPETYEVLRGLFTDGQEGEEAWQKYFLVPCMVNAYNAGSWTIGACLHEFVAAHSLEELQRLAGEEPGYDLFTHFTHFAKENQANRFTRNYGEDAQAYFISIAGCSEALKQYAV